MGSRRNRLLLMLLVVAAAGSAYYYYFFLLTPTEKPDDKLTLYGNVDIRQVDLAFHATGRVQSILVEEGQPVKEGQLAATIKDDRYRAAVDRAEAELAVLQENLDVKQAGTRPQNIREARAAVSAAKARLDEAEVTYERHKSLWNDRVVSRQALDTAERAYRTARADLAQARQALSLARAGPRNQEVAASRSRVEAARASLRLARERLADTRIYAPADGVVQKRIMQVGDMAFPQTPVLTLALTEPVWVRAYLPEPMLGRVKPGGRAEIATDSYPGRKYPGWVGYVSPSAEFTPKHVQTENLRTKLVYQVRIHACNPEGELRLGMPVTVTIPLDQPLPDGAERGRFSCGDD